MISYNAKAQCVIMCRRNMRKSLTCISSHHVGHFFSSHCSGWKAVFRMKIYLLFSNTCISLCSSKPGKFFLHKRVTARLSQKLKASKTLGSLRALCLPFYHSSATTKNHSTIRDCLLILTLPAAVLVTFQNFMQHPKFFKLRRFSINREYIS